VTNAPTPVTEAPTAPTEAAITEASSTPSPGPPTTPAAATGEEGGSAWWPWLLAALGVAAVIGVVVVVVRRSQKASPWPARTAAVLAESDEITTHLVGLAPSGLGSIAGADANRLATLMASVEQLMTSAPDETSRRALAALQDPLRSLHIALDAIALTPNPLSDIEMDEIRVRATRLHSATSLARATLLPRPPGSPV
jgi:hypothetical protein